MSAPPFLHFTVADNTNKKGVSLREIGRLSDIEPSIINKLANQKHQRIQLAHIERIAESLDVDDIRKIIDLADNKK